MKTKPSLPAKTASIRKGIKSELREIAIGQEHHPMMTTLYARAVAHLRTQRKKQKPEPKPPTPAAGPDRLLHELQVHQIELELQNEELRKARDAMEAGRDKYSDLYDFAPVGYLTLDRDGIIAEANLTVASLLGVTRGALAKRRFGAFVSPADRTAFAAFFQKVFKSKARVECDVRLLLNDTDAVDVRVRAIISSSGKACQMAVTDITERKQAEEKVRVSEIRYRRLFETAHDGVLLLNPATRKITDANPFMTSLLGYSHAQLVGKELFEIGLLEDQAASQVMFQKLKRDREVRYEDLPLKSQTGLHQEVEVVANIYQENGRAVIQCNIRDITERKQAEQMLRRSEALLSVLIEGSPFGIHVVDAELRLRHVNRSALPAFNNICPLIGRDFSEIVHMQWAKPVADSTLKLFRHTLETGEPYRAPEFAQRRRDTGKMEYYDWQIKRITLPDGGLGVVCFFNDITERRHFEETRHRLAVLAASNKKLEEEIVQRQAVEKSLKGSEQNKNRLLLQSRLLQEQLRQLSRQILTAQEEERRKISRELHDVIAQTLTGINLRLSALRQDAARNTKGLDLNFARTQREVEKSVNIVHQFARELRPAVLDDLGLIPALHAFLKTFSKRTGIRTRLTACAAVEKLDGSMRTVLYRVAQEALTNVARHAKASRVDVSILKLSGDICMRIKDDGKSFDAERVLQKTWKGRLGLLGMRERVEMVGGCFDIESAPGKGTTIVAHLPPGKVARGGGGRQRSPLKPRLKML